MSTRVRDLRSAYFHPGELPEDFPAWNKRVIRSPDLPAANTLIRISGPGTLGGVLIRRGAADVEVLVFDRPDANGNARNDELAAIAGVTGTARNIDGFVNMPIRMERGIVISVDQTDATVAIYFV